MAAQRVRLEKIPINVQQDYDISESVDAEVDESIFGGGFGFRNKKGSWVSVDAVELQGTGIQIVRLK